MARSPNESLRLFIALLITGGLLALFFWLLGGRIVKTVVVDPADSQNNAASPSPDSTAPIGETAPSAVLTPSLPDPQELTIDGSVTMVALMKQLQLAYTQVNPALPTTYGVPDGRPFIWWQNGKRVRQ